MQKPVKLGAKQLRSLIISEANKLNESAWPVNYPMKMTAIRTVADQMDFFDSLHVLGYRRKEDYNDSPSDDTITILSQKMSDDPKVQEIFHDAGIFDPANEGTELDEASGEAYGVGGVHEFAAACVEALKKYADLENVELPLRTEKLWLQMSTDFYLKNVDGPKGG